MLGNSRFFQQLRSAVAAIRQDAGNPENPALLDAMEVVINELLLRHSPAFYLDYLQRGTALLNEGRELAASVATMPDSAPLRAGPDRDAGFDAIQTSVDQLHEQLLTVVDALDEARTLEEKAYLVRLSEWEHGFYTHRLEQVSGFKKTQNITKEALQAYLERKLPEWKGVRVAKFLPLDGGFSKKTILFETEDEVNGSQSLVIRAEQQVNLLGYAGSDVTKEFHTIQLMREEGLPIAEPLWLEADPGELGVRFIVSRKAIGRTYGGNFGSEEPLAKELLMSLMSTFIKMHKIEVDPASPLALKSHLREWLPLKTVGAATRYCVTEFMRNNIARCDVRLTPQLLRALKWLERNVPECDEPPAVLHIDFAFNNLIIDGTRITAVLDWESSRLGDPAEDIIWTQQTLAPHISMPEFLRLYRAGTGRDISEYRIAYSRVAKCAVNAIAMFSALRIIEKHDVLSIKLAPLGLRYMALLGSNFNELIQKAEDARGS